MKISIRSELELDSPPLEVAIDFLMLAKCENGFTVDLQGREPSFIGEHDDPYVVSLNKFECAQPDFPSALEMKSFVYQNISELSLPGRFYGVWPDQVENVVCQDVNVLVRQGGLVKAVLLAHKNRQKAIYSYRRRASIRMDSDEVLRILAARHNRLITSAVIEGHAR